MITTGQYSRIITGSVLHGWTRCREKRQHTKAAGSCGGDARVCMYLGKEPTSFNGTGVVEELSSIFIE